MTKDAKPPAILEQLALAARSRNSPSYELDQLFRRKRGAAAALADALLSGAIELDARARAAAYHWLLREPQRGTLASSAVFEKGLEDRSPSVRQACRAALGGAAAEADVEAGRAEAVAEAAAGATGDPVLFDRLRELLLPRFPEVVPFDELSAALEVDGTRIRAEVAAMVRGWLERPEPPFGTPVQRPYLHVHGARYGTIADPFHKMLVPDPAELEALAHAGRYRDLDARLRTGMKAPPLTFSPTLRWRDGSPLSAGARAWVTAVLFAQPLYQHVPTEGERNGPRPVSGGADVIGVALDPDDLCAAVIENALSKPPKGVAVRIPYTHRERIADELGVLAAHRVLKRPLDAIQGFGTTRAGARWLARLERSVADEDLERAFPDGDDRSGSERFWAARIARVLEKALASRREIPCHHFVRCYLEHPLARRAIAGVVLETESGMVRVDADAPIALTGRRVRVAHPADGTERWPEGADGRFAQRTRPCFDVDALPEWPPPPIAHRAYLARVRATGMWSAPETLGGTVEASLGNGPGMRIDLRHAGYGSGYGGARPVELRSFQVRDRAGTTAWLRTTAGDQRAGWDRLEPGARSEAILLLRRLLGDEPLPEALPDEPLPPVSPRWAPAGAAPGDVTDDGPEDGS